MGQLHLAFVLDLFQPVSQSTALIDRIAGECYWPLVDLMRSDLCPKFTVSLANSLAKRLEDCGHRAILEAMAAAIRGGSLEMVHTGAYHPIFPLIPEQEVRRQIELDIDFKSKSLGLATRTGIFSPELCYDDSLVSLYRSMGFRWTLVDDQVMELNGIAVPSHELLTVDGFAVLMRSSLWSDRIRKGTDQGRHFTGREFVSHLEHEMASQDRDAYKIIALAGETFGHHVKYFQETFLRDLLLALRNSSTIRLCTVTELLSANSLEKREKLPEHGRPFTYFPQSSWATRPENHQRGDPYPLWASHGNPIHRGLWKLTAIILDACRDIDFRNPANEQLRGLLDQAFYSTQYFQSSIFFWDPSQVCQGINLQMRALYKCTELTGNRQVLNAGRDVYADLMGEIHKRAAGS